MQSYTKALIGCLVLFCLAFDLTNAASLGSLRSEAASALLKRGGASFFGMAKDLSDQSEEERGGSLRRTLSSKLSEKMLDKALNSSIVKSNPTLAAVAPLVQQYKPVISAKFGDFVENLKVSGTGSKAADQVDDEGKPIEQVKTTPEAVTKPSAGVESAKESEFGGLLGKIKDFAKSEEGKKLGKAAGERLASGLNKSDLSKEKRKVQQGESELGAESEGEEREEDEKERKEREREVDA